MRTIAEIVRLSVGYVCQRGGRPRREVEDWVASVLGLRRVDLYLLHDRPVEEGEVAEIRRGLVRLASGEPLAYILGRTSFYGVDVAVSQAVLIPRPDTETLVEVARAFMRACSAPGTLLDVGTGSGCVGLTLKKLFPSWTVVLSDISSEAIGCAKANAGRLGLEVEFCVADLFSGFGSRKAHCIVSNPPYLSSAEWLGLDPSVSGYEPRVALEAGPKGTEFYERFFAQARQFLQPGGMCALEIGYRQGAAVQRLAEAVGTPALHKDLAGRDRVVSCPYYGP